MAKTYKVPVCRTARAFAEIEVEADSAEEAERKAIDEAGDHEFLDKGSEYSVAGDAVATVRCSLCNQDAPAKTAHLHQGLWIGDECCWDERLRASE
jgi:hypothetical protein